VPPNSVLVKPAGPDCNLRCHYCFYRGKERLFPIGQHRMTEAVLERLIEQHMSPSAREVSFCWQGGEPTLMGLSFFERVVALQTRHGRGHRVGNALQTNAILLDERWAAFLARYNFLVGVSLDGDTQVHDANRRDGASQGTWSKVTGNIRMLLEAGVATNALTVVTEASAGRAQETYSFLQELGLRHMQFIPIVDADASAVDGVSPYSVRPKTYGIFLCELFDRWMLDLGGPRSTSVRTFDALLAHHLGLEPPECTMHATCDSYLVVEHNGAVYPCDFFVEPGWDLGNIMTSDLATLWRSPKRQAFGALKADLPARCRACVWLPVCRGGCTKDRVPGDAPRSTYLCEAYQALFHHAHERLTQVAAQHSAEQVRLAAREKGPRYRPAFGSTIGKIGRNVPCPCGSNSKYKKCCGR
jgi:uncharacterized protein